MDIVGKIPIRLAVLLAQAIAVNGGMHGPRMNFNKWIVLVNHLYPVTVVLEYAGKERGMHVRAEWALKIVKINDHDLGIRVATDWPALEVHLGHQVLGNIVFVQMRQGFAVLGNQKVMVRWFTAAEKGNNEIVIPGYRTGLGIRNRNRHLLRHVIVRANLCLDSVNYIGRQWLRLFLRLGCRCTLRCFALLRRRSLALARCRG